MLHRSKATNFVTARSAEPTKNGGRLLPDVILARYQASCRLGIAIASLPVNTGQTAGRGQKMTVTSEHINLGITDERGRVIGAVAFRESIPGQTGYIKVTVQATRNGTTFGPCQPSVLCAGRDSAHEEIERRTASMRARYARKYGKAVPK